MNYTSRTEYESLSDELNKELFFVLEEI